MSKSNDVSTLDHCPLADSELDAVTGGLFPGLTNMIADRLGDALGQAIDQAVQDMGMPRR